MNELFFEHRLIHRRASDFKSTTRVNSRRAPQRVALQQRRSFNTVKRGKSSLKTRTGDGRLANLGKQSQRSLTEFRRAKTTQNLRTLKRTNFESEGAYERELNRLQFSADRLNRVLTEYSDRPQGIKRDFSTRDKESTKRAERRSTFRKDLQENRGELLKPGIEAGPELDLGTVLLIEAENEKNFLTAEGQRDSRIAAKAAARAQRRSSSNRKTFLDPAVATEASVGGKAISNVGSAVDGVNRGRPTSRSIAEGADLTNSQRIGIGAQGTRTPRQRRRVSASAPPVLTPEADISSPHYQSGGDRRQDQAAGALQNDNIEAPGSLAQIRDEELEAIDPLLDSLSYVREGFKIYQGKSQDLLDKRGVQLEDYKRDSIDNAKQIAQLHIDQSKENRDLELELIEDARSRARRDELLTQEDIEREFDRNEDRVIGENKDRVERLNTSLGARYGGFGSGKGLKTIDSARKEGEKVLREISEDRVHAYREHQNKLNDIESDWRNDRKEAINMHDKNVTEVFTKLLERAGEIDDNILEEEGEQVDSAIELLREGFESLDKVWTKAGEELSNANRRALDRRDAVRKEEYDKSQDAVGNIFSGLNSLPTNSPLFNDFEKRAGLLPGTLASANSFEERRMAVSEGNYRLQQKELALQLQEFERDGNKIDYQVSKELGVITTSTGEIFRDYFGNPVKLVGDQGSITSSVDNDRRLYGDDSIAMNSTSNFRSYAMALGDIVPGSPYHKGGEFDIDNAAGTPIPAWTSGQVVNVNNSNPNDPYGFYVDVSDGTHTVRYAHLQQANVAVGDTVNGINSGQGGIIGTMGNTGNTMGMNGQRPAPGDTQTGSHLHLEVRTGTDFSKGTLVNPMDLTMQPGAMHSGNIKWVDEMRTKMKQGQPVGTREEGGTFSVTDVDTPWIEIDSQILELSKDVFKDGSGKTDWGAVELVYDYLLQNAKGDYQVSFEGKGAVQGSQQASKEIEYHKQIHGRSNVTEDRGFITKGFIEADTFFESLTDGTLDEMTVEQASEYMHDMGFVVEPGRIYGHNVRAMTDGELQVLNQRRIAAGLTPIE